MCGRYTLSTPSEDLPGLFETEGGLPALPPRYNIAPTQPVVAVRIAADGARRLALLRWGLIPSWAKDAAIGARLINARSETVAEKPAFRAALRQRRCLVPADGFYEWTREDAHRQPYLFRLRDGGPFAFAGLWEAWRAPTGDAVETCAILTTEANDIVRPVHERMPVILDRDDYALWLDPAVDRPAVLAPLFSPFRPELMVGYRVASRVNNAANDDEGCIAAA